MDAQILATGAYDVDRFTKLVIGKEAVEGFVSMFEAAIVYGENAQREINGEETQHDHTIIP